ncbi:SusD-like starch-binding protein associating with outer membrane [Flavobacteriaceae bacterium MAR_2010_105]|nr:SusD-like starch-binding protein associating with outer membrane [Flavobacteriaceae bacterium MAR_2010_105]
MKNLENLFKKPILVVLALMLAATSCDSWIDQDINVDPDAPANVPMNLLLPAIQQSMGYNLVGNNSVRTNNIWMQQFDGTDRQSFTEARYQLTPADVGNLWTPIYTEMLINSSIIIDKAGTVGKESPNYAGIAKVMMATALGIGSDLFGDMPYSEALKGGNNVLSPAYDSQESLYNSIFSLLDAAVVDLNSTNNALSVSGDVIYSGSAAKWKKAASSIKARHYLQLSGRNGSAAYTAALAAVSSGFTSNADDYKVPFSTDDKNPIHQFMEQRTDIRMGSTFVDMLKANDDPRLPFYAAKDGNGNYTGSVIGSQNGDASRPGTYVAGAASPTYLMTYAELKFIEAECRLMLNQSGAQAAYEAAVAASVLRVTGAANTAWLTANIVGDPVTLEKIMTQKYINSFGTNQAYADYRRTGFPALTIHPNAVIGQIPTRFPYPQAELDYNTENVPSVTISDKVWWDN